MSDPSQTTSRFAPQNKTTHERLSTNTVGLVALSDFRKRRAEVLEQQEREAREAALSSRTTTSTPDRSLTGTPNNASAEDSEAERQKKKPKKRSRALVSFGDDEEEADGSAGPTVAVSLRGTGKKNRKDKPKGAGEGEGEDGNGGDTTAVAVESASGDDKDKEPRSAAGKIAANTSVGIVPRALTKAALRREAAEREALRKEFLLLQTAVKASEIAIPFVFYDGTNIPGGIVRVKKGDFVWLFLDKSRKVGAQLGVGADKSANARRDWARVSVDDLLLVRGTMIVPHVSLGPLFSCISGKRPVYANPSLLSSIMTSISSSSTRPWARATSSSSTTAPKLPRLGRWLLVPARLALAARRVSLSSKGRRMTRRSPRWWIGGGISATSTFTRPACGRNSNPTRITRRRSGATPAGMPFSFRSKAAFSHRGRSDQCDGGRPRKIGTVGVFVLDA
jgi:protein FAM50